MDKIRKRHSRPLAAGQSIVESTGIMVVCALIVASLWGIGNQVMPILFEVLSDSNESAFNGEAE